MRSVEDEWLWEDWPVSGDPMDLELATTALLADNHDVRFLLRLLAGQLGSALGSRVEVQRRGGLLRRSDEVRSLRVTIGAEEFTADVRDSAVEASIGHTSGGIRIRTEKVAIHEWLSRLLGELRREAEVNQDARMALEKLVMGQA